MATTLAQSFDYCRRLTRRAARNFYYSFLTLPTEKRAAMCAIYAWMRRLDDLADDAPSPVQARTAVEAWRRRTHAALEATADPDSSENRGDPSTALLPALAHTVRRYEIPWTHFDEIAEGALMDQEITRYATFDDLYRYCYRVASVVGLVCLRVFGYSDPRAEKHGEWLGIAFQLTNILRDVREDAGRGRLYLPIEDLRCHGLAESDVMEGRWSPALHALLQGFAARAESYYVQARPVIGLVSPEAQPTLRIMTEIYHGILKEVQRSDYRVFERRARLPTWKKLAIVLKHQLRLGGNP